MFFGINFHLLGFVYIIWSTATVYYHDHISVYYVLLNTLYGLAFVL